MGGDAEPAVAASVCTATSASSASRQADGLSDSRSIAAR